MRCRVLRLMGGVLGKDGDIDQSGPNMGRDLGVIRDDFAEIGYAGTELNLGRLAAGAYKRDEPMGQNDAIPWYGRSLLADRQVALESSRGRRRPQLHVDLEHGVMFPTGPSVNRFPWKLLIDAAKSLSTAGKSEQRILPIGTLYSSAKHTYGRQ